MHADNSHAAVRAAPGMYAAAVAMAAALLFSCGVHADEPPDTDNSNVLTLDAAVSRGSCEYSVPQTVSLGNFIPSDFAATEPSTVRTMPFDVVVTNCTGQPGIHATPGLVFTGEVLPGNTAVFTDTPDRHVGFMFREGHYTGSLASFWGRPEEKGVVAKDELSGEGAFQEGQLPADGTVVPYTVGFVADGRPGTGDVRASVTIQISYK